MCPHHIEICHPFSVPLEFKLELYDGSSNVCGGTDIEPPVWTTDQRADKRLGSKITYFFFQP